MPIIKYNPSFCNQEATCYSIISGNSGSYKKFKDQYENNNVLDLQVNKLDSKQTTNRLHTVNKPGSKLVTNRKQTNYKPVTNYRQTDNNSATNRKQTVEKPGSNRSIFKLSGLQLSVLNFIYEECKKSRENVTKPLRLDEFSSQLNLNKQSVKTSIYRLEQKQYISRVEYKSGRGGWTKYELDIEIYHELLHQGADYKSTTNLLQTVNNLDSKSTTELTSSSIYNNTTTKLDNDWQKVDCSYLDIIDFNQNYISQLSKIEGLTPEQAQASIEHFAFDIEHNDQLSKIKTNPINYFIGILRRAGVYNAANNFENAKTRAMKIYLKQQEEKMAEQNKLEERLLNLHFEKWLITLNKEQRKQLASIDAKSTGNALLIKQSLKEYFKVHLWEEIREQVLSEINH